ncbi:MAG: hypothetical protein KatS3mg102_2507 [Planctomycetota bacterium]|nr:MAG: hypothetical protein KatS3mg102_2507 [Planctomycetota bacterium]
MERLIYEPAEVRHALAWLRQQADLLRNAHAANWRRTFSAFVAALRDHYEALRLLVRLLEGHRGVRADRWFAEAAAGQPPPPPAEGYALLALVWQQLAAAVARPGEGFATRTQIDFPFVLSNAFAGGSLGERFEAWRESYLGPFAALMDELCDRIEKALPAGGTFDLWDLAVAALTALPQPAELAGAAGRPGSEPPPRRSPSAGGEAAAPDSAATQQPAGEGTSQDRSRTRRKGKASGRASGRKRKR